MPKNDEDRPTNEEVERLYAVLGPLARGFLEEARFVERDRVRVAMYAISLAVDWSDLPHRDAVMLLDDVGTRRTLMRGDAADMSRLALAMVMGEVLDGLRFALEDGFEVAGRLAGLLRRGEALRAPN